MVPGTAPGVTTVPGLLFMLPGVLFTPAGVPIAPDVPGVMVVPGVATPGVVCAKAVVLRPKPSRAAPKICIVFIVVVYIKLRQMSRDKAALRIMLSYVLNGSKGRILTSSNYLFASINTTIKHFILFIVKDLHIKRRFFANKMLSVL
jgi:hypothetical protein